MSGIGNRQLLTVIAILAAVALIAWWASSRGGSLKAIETPTQSQGGSSPTPVIDLKDPGTFLIN